MLIYTLKTVSFDFQISQFSGLAALGVVSDRNQGLLDFRSDGPGFAVGLPHASSGLPRDRLLLVKASV